MTIKKDYTLFAPSFVGILYRTLRQVKGFNYHAEDYKWRFGQAVIDEYIGDIRQPNAFEIATLYGIEVEIDYKNPNNLQLFEDITNKIAIDTRGEENE